MSDQQNNFSTQQDNRTPQMPQGQPPKKNHTVLIVIVIVVIALVVLPFIGCVACSAGLSTAVNGTSSKVTSASSSNGSKSAAVKLYDSHGINITITEKGSNIAGAYYTLKIKNSSKSNVIVSITDLSVKGKMVNAWFYETVAKGKTDEAKLQTSDITDVDSFKNVEGTLQIFNSKTLQDIDSSTIKIK